MSTLSKARYSAKGRQKSQKRSQTGGDSAWQWQLNNLGDSWTQFKNTFYLQPGQSGSINQGNDIVQNNPKMNGGKRSSMMKMRQRQMLQSKTQSRGKKGGFFGPVLEQAAVPLALLGAQQYYGKKNTRKHNGRNKSFRRRH
jgi:hypothetical protein